MADPDRLTDAEILRSVDETVLGVLLPALRDDADWARAAAIQLVGLVRYAAGRGADPTTDRIEELAEVLARLSANELVTWDGECTVGSVNAAAGSAIAAAIGRDDAAADEVRRELRSVVVRQLDDELAETAPLVDAFRGRLDA